jgi:hypothetical protein
MRNDYRHIKIKRAYSGDERLEYGFEQTQMVCRGEEADPMTKPGATIHRIEQDNITDRGDSNLAWE